MISVRATVTGKTPEGMWVTVDARTGCIGCGGGRCATKRRACLAVRPGAHHPGERVVLSVSARDALDMMLHSLLLPLAGFVAGAVCAHILGAGDAGAVAGALVGMSLGLGLCRVRSFNRIQIDRGQ